MLSYAMQLIHMTIKKILSDFTQIQNLTLCDFIVILSNPRCYLYM
jgi:hypothetical protein